MGLNQNGNWVVIVEAERDYLSGRIFRSMYKVLEITPDGPIRNDKIQTRFESFESRKTRRNWSRDDDNSGDG